jgi:hypothetical protein
MKIMVELEELSKEELTRLVKKESLDRFIYIQFSNKKEFKKASDILWDEKLPCDLLGYRALRVSKVIAQYLKKVHGFNFYEYGRRGEEIERFEKGLVK